MDREIQESDYGFKDQGILACQLKQKAVRVKSPTALALLYI